MDNGPLVGRTDLKVVGGVPNMVAKLLTGIVVIRALFGNRGATETPPLASSTRPLALPRSGENTGGASPAAPGSTDHGSEPESPLELSKPDWKRALKLTLKEIKEDRVTLVAAGMAYYAFLAIFPAVIAAIGLLGLVHASSATITDFQDALASGLPAGVGGVLVDAVGAARNPSDAASLTAALVGVAVALWSASSGFVGLQSGLNVAYDIDGDRKFAAKRGVALLLILATGLLGGVPTPFIAFDAVALKIVGLVATAAAVTVLFSLFYYIGPKRESPRWVWVTPGGIVGMLLWIAASIAFSVYVDTFSSYGKTYGTLAGVIVLILWLYLSSLAIMIGGELNSVLERQKEMRGLSGR